MGEAAALMPALAPKGFKAPTAPHAGTPMLSAGGFHMPLGQFLHLLSEHSDAALLVTDGAKGSYIHKDSALYFAPAQTAVVAGTAGAGDAFCSTFAVSLADGASLANAAYWAAPNAASVVAHIDTQTGLLARADITRKSAPQSGFALKRL